MAEVIPPGPPRGWRGLRPRVSAMAYGLLPMAFRKYVAIGDSSTVGLDDPDGKGGYRGWADRLAERVDRACPGLLYANLAVSGKLTREIRDEQLGPALAMKPDLATVFAGSNDILRRRFDPTALHDDVLCMQSTLRALGATVLTFTLPDLAGVMPIGRFLRSRVRAMNDALRAASLASGSILVDFAEHAVGSDRRLWSDDRFHVNAEGHSRIAAALAHALDLPGADAAWSEPLPADGRPGWFSRCCSDLGWVRRHLLRKTPLDVRPPKRSRLAPTR